MAAAYGNTPNVMYETWNEPVQESWATIKAYHEKVITAIRAVDPDNIVICGNPNWDQRSDLAAADPIKISGNIAYSIHFYAATHKQQFRNYATIALNKGIALFSTEYGTSEASGNGNFDAAETQLWWDFFKKNGIGSANWSCAALGETSAAFKDGTSATNWTDANLKPSGTLVKAFIISQYMSTVGLMPRDSRPTRYELGKGLSITALDAGADAVNALGARIAAPKAPSSGHYLLTSPQGRARSLSVLR
jgi:endoglucanase